VLRYYYYVGTGRLGGKREYTSTHIVLGTKNYTFGNIARGKLNYSSWLTNGSRVLFYVRFPRKYYFDGPATTRYRCASDENRNNRPPFDGPALNGRFSVGIPGIIVRRRTTDGRRGKTDTTVTRNRKFPPIAVLRSPSKSPAVFRSPS